MWWNEKQKNSFTENVFTFKSFVKKKNENEIVTIAMESLNVPI